MKEQEYNPREIVPVIGIIIFYTQIIGLILSIFSGMGWWKGPLWVELPLIIILIFSVFAVIYGIFRIRKYIQYKKSKQSI